MKSKHSPFISFLIERGVVQNEDLEKASSSNEPLDNAPIEERLLASGLLTEDVFRSCAEEFFEVPFATPADWPQEPVLINNLSAQFMKESRFIPARLADIQLTL